MATQLGVRRDEARIRDMRARGLWTDRLLIDNLADAVARTPEKMAVADYNSELGRTRRFTYRELDLAATRIGLGLAAEGVEAGDVVAMQLPNWFEAMAIAYGCWKIGAIVNPLMPIFRARELTFMLGFAEAKAFIAPKAFRGFDHAGLAHEMQAALPHLANVHIVGDGFQETFLDRAWEAETDAAALFAARRPEADAAIQLIYTSGTTGEPKGVLHSANTLMGNMPAFIARGAGADVVVFMPSPIAHQTGFLVGVILPPTVGASVVYQDIWDGATAARIMADERCGLTMASTPFLADLIDAPNLAECDLSAFRTFLCAGAPVPRVLVERAAERMGADVLSGWGMSENGLATACYPGDAADKTVTSDGRPSPGLEVAVFDDDGRPAAVGEEGALKSRGASLFLGYLKRPELAEIDAEGWFDSGDRATLDADGYIRIVGRAKDIIIRGGENIPVVEVEELLYRMPEVAAAAIVAMPDDRLGERGCAFVEWRGDDSFDFAEMTARLLASGLSKTYLPERLEPIAAMPRTPSGKIQKFVLREMAQGLKPMRG